MSEIGPTGGGQNPFQNIFGDLARLLGNGGSSLNWDVARQVAALIAGEGQSEGNVEPADRIRLEELIRVAQLHVDQVTGLSPVVGEVRAVNHVDWALNTLDDYKTVLLALAESLTDSPEEGAEDVPTVGGIPQLADMQKFLSPVLLGIQVGGMIGHLSRRTCGQYDLPIPRNNSQTVSFVPANLNVFAEDWSLPKDELDLYVCIEELTRVAIFQRAHVRERFTELITQYVSGFQPDPDALEQQLSGLDLQDPSEIPAALSNPDALLGAMTTPEQSQTLAKLSALTAAFVGYVDWVAGEIAPRLIPSGSAIAEANKRRRVEESDGARLVERLLGLELSQPQFDRGTAFVHGVLERAGDAGLDKLWATAANLPTPAEIDAPGLWLARIDLELPEAGSEG